MPEAGEAGGRAGQQGGGRANRSGPTGWDYRMYETGKPMLCAWLCA